MSELTYKTLRADLTEEQWRVVVRLVREYEHTNVLDRATDVTPDGFDRDGGKIWHVWSEGYSATGEHGTAHFIGKKWAKSFDRACELLHIEKGGRLQLGDFTHETDTDPPRYWGCRLFDNERQAREAYG